ncbi:MAG TPA: hypothetical protein VEI97_10240, partial [bacterium]|nr:hypothetical protein [bacterium]
HRITITSPQRFRPFVWQDTAYVPVHARDFFGARAVTHRAGLTIEVSDFEKTFLDCLQRFDLAGGMVPFYRALHRFGFLNPARLMEYLDRFGSQALKVRAGFTLYHLRNRWDIPPSVLNRLLDLTSSGPYFLDRSLPTELCDLDPLWNCWIPKDFAELTRPVE